MNKVDADTGTSTGFNARANADHSSTITHQDYHACMQGLEAASALQDPDHTCMGGEDQQFHTSAVTCMC